MPKPTRVVIPIDSDDPDAWRYALGCAAAIAQGAQPPARDIILLTHTKEQLRHTSLVSHVGERRAKGLLDGGSLTVSPGLALRHATRQTLRGAGRGAVVIVYYADDGILELIDGLDGVVGIVAVPWVYDQIERWIARWNPKVHGQAATAAAPLIVDTVVEKALTALSSMANLAHGVFHPRDKEYANETLRILRANGHRLDADQIKSWAIRNGWKPGAADELAKLAGRIAALKTKPSLSGFHDPRGRYARWSS